MRNEKRPNQRPAETSSMPGDRMVKVEHVINEIPPGLRERVAKMWTKLDIYIELKERCPYCGFQENGRTILKTSERWPKRIRECSVCEKQWIIFRV